MKKLHNPVCNFYVPENEPCFRVGDNIHSRQLNIRQQGERRVHIHLVIISKVIQNTLQH
jgi:hypothetical protein